MQIFDTQAQRSILWSLSHTLLFLISYCLLFIFKWTSTPHIIGSLVQVKAGLWTSITFFLKHTYCPQEQVCIVSRFSHRSASWWLLRKGLRLKESKPIDPVITFLEYKSDFFCTLEHFSKKQHFDGSIIWIQCCVILSCQTSFFLIILFSILFLHYQHRFDALMLLNKMQDSFDLTFLGTTLWKPFLPLK